MSKRIVLDRIVIEKGDKAARANRRLIDKAGVFAVNLIGAPGCGKTTLLERTIAGLRSARPPVRMGVIEGDVQTTIDRDRILRAGAPAVQIETQGACRLDAAMVAGALAQLQLDELDLLVIENVGNLVCPAEPQLGEHIKVAVIGVPEGDDKPAKYPAVFVRADAVVITKIDLLPYVQFDSERFLRGVEALNHGLRHFRVSCRTGEGLEELARTVEAHAGYLHESGELSVRRRRRLADAAVDDALRPDLGVAEDGRGAHVDLEQPRDVLAVRRLHPQPPAG